MITQNNHLPSLPVAQQEHVTKLWMMTYEWNCCVSASENLPLEDMEICLVFVLFCILLPIWATKTRLYPK